MDFTTVKRSLCWDCRNATGGCSWSDELKLKDGQKVKKERGGITVVKCPKFDRDSYGAGVYSEEEYRKILVNRKRKHRSMNEREAEMYALLVGGMK